MATVTTTDLEWIAALAALTNAAIQVSAPGQGPNSVVVIVSVDLTASEVLTGFTITLPFSPPAPQIALGKVTWDNPALAVTSLDSEFGATPVVTVSGENTTGSPQTVNFSIVYVICPPPAS